MRVTTWLRWVWDRPCLEEQKVAVVVIIVIIIIDYLGNRDNHYMVDLRTGQRLALKKCKFGSEITLTQK